MNIYYDISKIKRAIDTHGQSFTFLHPGANDYGEPTDNYGSITVKGLFHQTRGYITKNVTDGTISRSKPQPQILTLYDITSTIKLGDKLNFAGHTYNVTGVDNIGNLNIALDISLEMIDNGT